MAADVTKTPEDSAEKAFAQAVEAAVTLPPLTAVKPTPKTAPATASAADAKPAEAAKPVATAKPASVVAPAAAPKATAPKAAKRAKPKTSRRPAKPTKKTVSPKTPLPKIKESIMATKKTPEFTEGLKAFAADAQKQAQSAYAKGSELLAEAGEFTKGNAEALVESGKILASGLQGLGKAYVAETKTAVEVATADVKAFAAVRSPVDFVKLQGDILRRNTENVFAFSTKNSEAMMKLASDAFAPISGRFSLAFEKIKKAA